MLFFTAYVLVTACRRSKCFGRKYKIKSDNFNASTITRASCFNSSTNKTNKHNLTVKDASTIELSKSVTCDTNHTEPDARPSLQLRHDLNVPSVFEPDYLNDFYSRILFRQSTSDKFDNVSRKSESELSIDILNELYIDSKKIKNYENVEFSGRGYEKNLMQKPKVEYSVGSSENKKKSSYIYSLPSLIGTNFQSSGGSQCAQPELRPTNLDSPSSFLQGSSNQIMLDNSHKSSSDQMLKNLLEKFEIIYNDSVIQNKNLGVQLTNMNESLNTSQLIN